MHLITFSKLRFVVTFAFSGQDLACSPICIPFSCTSKNFVFETSEHILKMRLILLWCMTWESLSLADPIYESTTSLNKPSTVTYTTVDTITQTRMIDHDAINQNKLLASGFSKAQSMIASAADGSKRSHTSIPMLRESRDIDKQPEEPVYFTITLLVNGYDVTVPILRENATDFCKSMTNEMEGSASGTTTSTNKNEPTEAPNATEQGGTDDPESKTTEELTSSTTTNTPSPSTKSHESDTASTQYSDLPTVTPRKTSDSLTPSFPESSLLSKSPTKKLISTVVAVANVKSAPDHTSPSRTTHNSITESLFTIETTSSRKYTVTVQFTTITEENLTLTITSPTSAVDDAGKSRKASQIMADKSKAWVSYSSYIVGIHSRLNRRESNA
jgi:hypothetical protein